MTTAQPHATSAYRSLILIGAVVVALIVTTAGMVFLAGNRAAQTFPADTPKGTLQRYLTSFDEGEYAASYAFFSDRVHDATGFEAYERAIDAYGYHGNDGTPPRVLIDSVTGRGDHRDVHLTVEEFYGDGLSGNSYRSEREIRVVRQPDGWRIDEPLVWLDPAPLMEEAH
jgi:hypothetical protein